MESVVLVIHLILAVAIILLVLLQRSEGGGLGIGGGNGGMGGFASARGTANALTKMTAFCAAAFFVTSLTLGVLASQHSKANQGILEDIDESAIAIEAPTSTDEVPGISYTPPKEIPSLNVETQATTENNDNKTQPTQAAEEPTAPVE